MEFVFRSRFIHFVVAIRDFDKDEPELEFVSNSGGNFEALPSFDDDEPDSGTCTEPLDMRFGFRSTEMGGDG